MVTATLSLAVIRALSSSVELALVHTLPNGLSIPMTVARTPSAVRDAAGRLSRTITGSAGGPTSLSVICPAASRAPTTTKISAGERCGTGPSPAAGAGRDR